MIKEKRCLKGKLSSQLLGLLRENKEERAEELIKFYSEVSQEEGISEEAFYGKIDAYIKVTYPDLSSKSTKIAKTLFELVKVMCSTPDGVFYGYDPTASTH